MAKKRKRKYTGVPTQDYLLRKIWHFTTRRKKDWQERAKMLPEKQKCSQCGFEIDTREIVKDMESVMEIAEKMDYGEPEVQCPNCLEWFCLQTL